MLFHWVTEKTIVSQQDNWCSIPHEISDFPLCPYKKGTTSFIAQIYQIQMILQWSKIIRVYFLNGTVSVARAGTWWPSLAFKYIEAINNA